MLGCKLVHCLWEIVGSVTEIKTSTQWSFNSTQRLFKETKAPIHDAWTFGGLEVEPSIYALYTLESINLFSMFAYIFSLLLISLKFTKTSQFFNF